MSNSRTQPSDHALPVAEYATGRLWGALLDEDPLDVEVELLAAYSEGALDEPERQRLKSMIARSPRAMELLHGLRTDLRVAAPDALPQTSPARPVARPNRMLTVMSWLVAVALLIAFGTTFQQLRRTDRQQQRTNQQLAQTGQQLQVTDRELQGQRQLVADLNTEKGAYEQQIAALNAQLARESAVAAVARREQLYKLTSGRLPCMTFRGERNTAALAIALNDQTSRGIEKSSPETQAATDAEINTLLDQAEAALSARPDDATARLELAAQFLAAGRFDDARQLIAQIEQQSGETAATLNLRAAIDLTDAYELATLERAREMQSTARELLQRATQLDPQDPRPWFNLALLEEDLQDAAAAGIAWGKYLALETDEALKKLVLDNRTLDP